MSIAIDWGTIDNRILAHTNGRDGLASTVRRRREAGDSDATIGYHIQMITGIGVTADELAAAYPNDVDPERVTGNDDVTITLSLEHLATLRGTVGTELGMLLVRRAEARKIGADDIVAEIDGELANLRNLRDVLLRADLPDPGF